MQRCDQVGLGVLHGADPVDRDYSVRTAARRPETITHSHRRPLVDDFDH